MKARILLAEDNKDAAEIVLFVLQYLGYEVILARNGIEAVESALSLHPDLIIMDMMMPRMDGYQAVAELRQHPQTRAIPILAATANIGSHERQKCLACGCDEYMPKPLLPRELAPVVERLLKSTANGRLAPAD